VIEGTIYKEVMKMTRARAWTVSIIATVSLLALVFGIGASTGQFGFQQGGTSAEAQAGSPGDAIVSQQPSAAGFDDDDREGYEEHEDDHDGEHEGDDHEAYEDDEHEDDD
jgi:hypothetical protein